MHSNVEAHFLEALPAWSPDQKPLQDIAAAAAANPHETVCNAYNVVHKGERSL